MNSYIKNPKILLLKCSIEYLYREETKFTCIEPIVLQVSICLLQFIFFIFFAVLSQIHRSYFFVSGTRVFEELCSTHSGRPAKPSTGGENCVSNCSGHAAGAWNHLGDQCQTGQLRIHEIIPLPLILFIWLCVSVLRSAEGLVSVSDDAVSLWLTMVTCSIR